VALDAFFNIFRFLDGSGDGLLILPMGAQILGALYQNIQVLEHTSKYSSRPAPCAPNRYPVDGLRAGQSGKEV